MARIGFGNSPAAVDTDIKQPSGYSDPEDTIGAVNIMADGSIRKDFIRTVHRWSLSWSNLTRAQRNTLRSYYRAATPLFFSDLDGVLWNVLITGSYESQAKMMAGGDHRYDVTLEFRELGRAEAVGVFRIDISGLDGLDGLDGTIGAFAIDVSALGGTDGLTPL